MARWALLPTLLDLGCPTELPSQSAGAPALHYAAAFGPIDAVRLLVDHGADLDRRDVDYGATPIGWAEFFGNNAALAELRTRDDDQRRRVET
jgi:ankyrin repeat protein